MQTLRKLPTTEPKTKAGRRRIEKPLDAMVGSNWI
jgi:hypothetical protein